MDRELKYLKDGTHARNIRRAKYPNEKIILVTVYKYMNKLSELRTKFEHLAKARFF